jgi:hypothetical protein
MIAADLLEPSRLFKTVVKPTHRENCEAFYDQMIRESKVDVELNKLTVKNIKAKQEKINKQEKSLKGKKALKGFLIFLGVAFLIAGIVLFIYSGDSQSKGLFIGLGVGAIVLSILVFVLTKLKVSKAIKNMQEVLDTLLNEKTKLVNEAIAQMAPLNELFDWSIPATLFTKTIPLIQLDPVFDQKRYLMLHEKYGYNGNPEKNISTLFVQSGSILGNPFLIERNYVQDMHDVPYTGSITISWTTTYTDSQGNTHTQTHTQTLTATIYKPAPFYYHDTYLVYGSDAASNLSFSRSPSKANSMTPEKIRKESEKYDKTLDKLTQQAIKKEKSFQRLGNAEFEYLFNALDRDNNMEFRLLFTPAAQKNLCDLIKSKEPYGDDFSFVKRKSLNFIKSAHSQNTNYDSDPNRFMFYDCEESRDYFIKYNEAFMQSLYYDLAPIMSIPLYHQYASKEYIYKGTISRNVADIETEVMANGFDSSMFMPEDSVTEAILKTELVAKQGDVDVNKVHAYAFRTVRHVDYVSKMGGDGHSHSIPVEWLEYIPVQKTTEIAVQKCVTTKKEYDNNYRNGLLNQFLSQFTSNNAMIYKKGFISFLCSRAIGSYMGNELNNIFKKGEK